MENAETTGTDLTTVDNSSGEIVSHKSPLDALLAKVGATGIKVVTRSVLQQVAGRPIAVKFESAAYQGEELVAGKGQSTKMQPARLADIINLETGEAQSLIMNTVLEGELVRAFGKVEDKAKEGGYVGRSFVIGSEIPVDGDGKAKRYRVYKIAELTFNGDETAENVASADKVADGSAPVARDGKSKPKG